MKRWILILAGVIFLGIFVFWLSAGRSTVYPIHFTNGAKASVVGVEFGTNFTYSIETNFLRKITKPLRTIFPRLSAERTAVYSAHIPSLLLWVEEQDPQLGKNGIGHFSMFRTDPGDFFGIVQDDNKTVSLMPLLNTGIKMESRNKNLFALIIHQFPRRSKKIQVSFYRSYRTNMEYIGTVAIPNPTSLNFPNWQPESLPVTKKDADLEVTLVRYRAGLPFPDSQLWASGLPTNAQPKEEAVFKIQQNGKNAAEKWNPSRIERMDLTGNWSDATGHYDSNIRPTGEQILLLNSFFMPTEPVAKMRVEFSSSGSVENDLMRFKPITVPPPGKFTTDTQEVVVQGVKVKLVGMSAPSVILPGEYPPNKSSRFRSSQYILYFHCEPVSWHHRLQAVAVADQNNASLDSDQLSLESSPGIITLAVGPETTAKTVQPFLALSRIRSFEFTFKPEWVNTNFLIHEFMW